MNRQYWGFDLGDGESTVARTDSESRGTPAIVPVDGRDVMLDAPGQLDQKQLDELCLKVEMPEKQQ